MRFDSNELILNHISTAEHLLRANKDPKEFAEYEQMAFMFLNHKGKHLFEEDILNRFPDTEITLQKIFEQSPRRYLQGVNHMRNGKMEHTWYDLWDMEEIVSGDNLFDYFFACKLRHGGLLGIDELLDFHLDYSFGNDKPKFYRFIDVLITQYKGHLLNEDIIDIINGWKKLRETEAPLTQELAGTGNEEKIKGRIQREPNDHLTALSVNQTALLIEFMQQAGIILKGDYLTYTQAGKAFNILTGYSAHTLRQQLGAKGLMEGVKYDDYQELYEALQRLLSLIEPKLRKK